MDLKRSASTSWYAVEPSSVRIYGVAAVVDQTATAKILIVDDDEGVTQTFARMLRLEGYQVATAISAQTGLQEEIGRAHV